jgi:hypothetical protein
MRMGRGDAGAIVHEHQVRPPLHGQSEGGSFARVQLCFHLGQHVWQR